MLHHYRRLSLDGRPTSPSVAALVGMVVSSAYTSALPYYRTVGGAIVLASRTGRDLGGL
jgi:hypothetical protein